MANALWAVPLVLLALQFAMKLFVAEPPSGPRTWETTLQAPVEIGFLALSFAAAVILSTPDQAAHVFSISIVFIVALIFSIVLWKISPTHFTVRGVALSACLCIVNFSITILMLVYSIGLLTRRGSLGGS